MYFVARTLRFLAVRFLADPHRPTRQDQVAAYLGTRRPGHHRATQNRPGQGSTAGHAR